MVPTMPPIPGPTIDPSGPTTLQEFLPWLVFLGVLLGVMLGILLLLLIFWRAPVYVTGFLPDAGELRIGRKKDTLRSNGRFVFPKVYMGKHTLTFEQSKYRIRLKRRKKIDQEDRQEQQEEKELRGIAFEVKDDLLTIYIGKKVTAIELYLLSDLTVRQQEWAAIDEDHNVITPAGVQEPDEDGNNTTPGGLHIDENGVLDVDVDESVPAK